MQTKAEIEEQLGQAAMRMRQVSKAAKDQAAAKASEPAELPRSDLGQTQGAPGPVIQPQR